MNRRRWFVTWSMWVLAATGLLLVYGHLNTEHLERQREAEARAADFAETLEECTQRPGDC